MNLLYLAPIAFDDLKQRPQYLAEGLSKYDHVYYVEPTISFLTALHHKGLSSRGRFRKYSKNLTIVRLDGKLSLPYRLKYLDQNYRAAFFEYLQLKKIIHPIDIIWTGYPGWLDLLHYLKKVPVVYDIMDDYVLLTRDFGSRRYIKAAQEVLEQQSAQVATSSLTICKRLRKRGIQAHLVPNAVPGQYAKNFEIRQAPDGVRTFTYIGTIAEWFDNAALQCIADCTNCRVVLVGPVSIPRIPAQNIYYIGKVPKENIPGFIKASDVCLYPFRANELLDTINPVKIYEYLAFNRPVIARRSRETEAFERYIYLYSDLTELKEILRQELDPPFRTREEYVQFLSKNTWNVRVRQARMILDKALGGNADESNKCIWNKAGSS